MANKKITQLTAASSNISSIDLMEISENNGAGVFSSRKITGFAVQQGFMTQNAYLSAFTATSQIFVSGVDQDVVFDTSTYHNKITLGGFNELIVDEAGIYQVDFTATIFNNGGNANYKIGFYLKVFGSDVADSSKFMNAPVNGHSISFQTSWIVQMSASQDLVIVCLMQKDEFELLTENTVTGVTTPSAQVIMKRIG